MPVVSELMAKVGLDDSDFQSGTRRVADGMKQTTEGAEKAASSVRHFGETVRKSNSDLKEFGQVLSVGVTAPLVALGAGSLKAATDMDSLKRGLTAVAGSSREAEIQLERLKEVAKMPGLGLKEAIQGSINLQATGLSAELAERSLKAFGNALGTVGKGKAELDGVILALGQIQSKGKVSAEEINQLAERVPQIRQMMKDAFGTADTEALQKMGITSEEFVTKVVAAFEKLPPVTTGIQNDIENMGDTIFQAASKIGERLTPVASMIIGTVVPAIEKGVDWFSKLPLPIQGTTLAIMGIGAAVGPTVYVFTTLFDSLGKLKKGWEAIVGLKPFVVSAFTGKAAAVKTATLATQEQIYTAGLAAQKAYEETAANGSFAQAANAATAARTRHLGVTVEHTGAITTNTGALNGNTSALTNNGAAATTAAAGRGFMGTGVGGATVATSALVAVTTGYQIGSALDYHLLGGKEREEKNRESDDHLKTAEDSLKKQGLTPNMTAAEIEKKANDRRKAQGLPYYENGKLIRPVQTAEQKKEDLNRTYNQSKEGFEKASEQSENAFRIQVEQAKSRINRVSSENKAQAELQNLMPVLVSRQRMLAEENKKLEPFIRANHDAMKVYQKNNEESWKHQADIEKMKTDVAKSNKEAQEKNAKASKDALQKQFETAVAAAKADAALAPENMKAIAEAERLIPIIENKQAQLVAEAKSLEPTIKSNAENRKKYWDLMSEVEKLEEQKNGLDRSALMEGKRNQEKATKDAKAIQDSYFNSLKSQAKARALQSVDEQRSAAMAQEMIPVIEQQQASLLREMQALSPQTKEYWDKHEAVWNLEAEKQKFMDDASKEEQRNVKKAKDEAKKALNEAKKRNKEHLELLDARMGLMKAQLDNNPWLTDQQKQQQLVPLMLQQIKALASPVQGETELEKVKRLTEIEQTKGQIFEAAGLKGGNNSIFADPRLLNSVGSMIDSAIREGQKQLVKPKPVNSVGNQPQFGPGSEDYRNTQNVAKNAANGRPIVFQLTLQPGASRQDMWNSFVQMYDSLARQDSLASVD